MIKPNQRPAIAGKGMLYRLLSFICFVVLPLAGIAQNGTEMYDAIYAGSFGSCGGTPFNDWRNNSYYNGISYTDTYNYYTNYGHGQDASDVWYTFNVSDNTDIEISLCGSNYDTYVHLLDANGNEIYYDDDGSNCGGNTSYLTYSGLGSGFYYVVVEGFDINTGNFSLAINSLSTGTPSPGANMTNAINAGTFSSSGSYNDSRSNADACLGDDYGQDNPDIYYKFTLNGAGSVKLSH